MFAWLGHYDVKIDMWVTIKILLLHRAKLPQPGCHVAVVTGKRYTAKEARDAGFINEVSLDNSKFMERAVHLGENLSQSDVDRIFLSDFKHDLYHSLCHSLKQSPVVISHIWY